MPAGEMDGLKFRGDGDHDMGEKMMEVAVALMRRVDESLEKMDTRQMAFQERVEKKLDDIGKERMREARESGENAAVLNDLKSFKEDHIADHKWVWRAIVTACLASVGAVVVALFKR